MTENELYKFTRAIEEDPLFKALDDKTQVFNTRVSEEVKSRGSHCLDVGQISASLVAGLGGSTFETNKAYLIGLLHDIGHIPFGHAGESIAAKIIEEADGLNIDEIISIRKKLYGEDYVDGVGTGKNLKKNITFEHNENSVLQYLLLCDKYGVEPDEEIMTGILAHSTSRYADVPPTLAEQAVRLADKLAYINYDINDLMISFQDKPEEYNALIKMYDVALKGPDGEEIKISLNGREYSLLEFIQLTPKDRIDAFLQASIQDAIDYYPNRDNKYESYASFLTGCNDTVLEIGKYQKMRKNAKKELDNNKDLSEERVNELKANIAKYDNEIKILNHKLYERSPMLYAAYQIKEKTDNYIRAGADLSLATQIKRTTQAQSAVGNYDLLNEFIYKTIIENFYDDVKENELLGIEEIRAKYARNPEFYELYQSYMEYREVEQDALKKLPGNTEGLVYPELYTIVNFIGTHTNTEMYALAEKYGLFEQYTKTVLPELQELQTNKLYYDETQGVLTPAGQDRREEIVKKYGAQIKLDFSLEEEGLVPTASEETIQLMIDCGYLVVTDTHTLEPRRVEINHKFKSIKPEQVKEVKQVEQQEARLQAPMIEELMEQTDNTGISR